MENRIKEKINYLNSMAAKYSNLNERTKGKYRWREDAIHEHIYALENILNDKKNEWDECYDEDLKESEENN